MAAEFSWVPVSWKTGSRRLPPAKAIKSIRVLCNTARDIFVGLRLGVDVSALVLRKITTTTICELPREIRIKAKQLPAPGPCCLSLPRDHGRVRAFVAGVPACLGFF